MSVFRAEAKSKGENKATTSFATIISAFGYGGRRLIAMAVDMTHLETNQQTSRG
jgi:hypothetical protein